MEFLQEVGMPVDFPCSFSPAQNSGSKMVQKWCCFHVKLAEGTDQHLEHIKHSNNATPLQPNHAIAAAKGTAKHVYL